MQQTFSLPHFPHCADNKKASNECRCQSIYFELNGANDKLPHLSGHLNLPTNRTWNWVKFVAHFE